ncbi:MAG: cache domain-containing protein [Cytophagaceae bacterium]
MSFIKNLSISQRLFLSYLSIGVVAVVVSGWLFFMAFREAIIERTLAQLSSINVLKKARIDDYFAGRKRSLALILNDSHFQEAFSFYLSNPSDGQVGGSVEHFEVINNLVVDHHYQDVLFLNNVDEIIYTQRDDAFLIKMIVSDNEEIKHFLEKARKGITRIDVSMHGNLAETIIFIGAPVYSEDNRFQGTIVLHKKFTRISDILHERTGMGNSGESYIVDRDFRMRSVSRFYPDKPPLKIIVNTEAVSNAFAGIDGNHILADYRGVSVLSVYRRLNMEGLDWVLISEIDLEEAMLPVTRIRVFIVYVSVLVIILLIWITLLLGDNLTRPIRSLKVTIDRLARGILPDKAQEPKYNDEIGEMVLAVNRLAESFEQTSKFARRIGNNELNAEYRPLSEEDVLGISLLQMRDSLKKLKEQEKRLNRQRSAALIEGQENERRRFAREIHDGLGQMLVAIKFKIAALEEKSEAKTELRDLLNETIEEVRRISNNVMPGVLLDFGLEAGLNQLCQNLKKITNINITFTSLKDEEQNPLDFDITVGLYRIAQEALNNIVKYAEASKAEVELVHDKELVMLLISDDGIGFDYTEWQQNSNRANNGIKNMRERSRLMNGSFYIHAEKQKGTTIKVEVPLHVKETEDDHLIEE